MDNVRLAGLAVMAGLIWFYWFRVERVKRIRMADQLSQTESQQLQHSSRYPFVSAKDEVNSPIWTEVPARGYDREGTYGIPRRDYKGIGGTTVVSNTDAFTNW